MYQANFYGQSTLGPYLMRNSLVPYEKLPKNAHMGDEFVNNSITTFEKKLHNEINYINQMSVELRAKLQTLDHNKIDPDMKKEIIENYHIIKQKKQLLAFVVEQMQKCMQAMAANFR